MALEAPGWTACLERVHVTASPPLGVRTWRLRYNEHPTSIGDEGARSGLCLTDRVVPVGPYALAPTAGWGRELHDRDQAE